MTVEITQSEELVKPETSLAEIKTENEASVTKMTSKEPLVGEQWKQFGEKTSVFLDSLQGSITNFFNQYQAILVTLGWILLALITVKVTLAVLDALNDIPFLAVLLELIGLGYVIWFGFRYLLSAANRQELSQEIQSLQQQFLGKKS